MSTRHIGLSLGADLCWPQFYEDILAEMSPVVEMDGETVDFEVERITIEPFDLDQPVKYDVVLDRLTPWYHTSREWIKKAVVKDDLYVLNNPFTLQAMQKHTSYAALMRLGAEIPETWLLPPKEYGRTDPLEADLDVTLDRYAQMFDLRALGERIGYPMFMKPYDGGAWVGVTKIDDGDALVAAYEASGSRIMHLQKAVFPFDLFVRCLGVGPQVNIIKYDPDAPLHDRYKVEFNVVDGAEWEHLVNLTLTINTFFGWDFNSCEALRQDGSFYPIDFANANPDSQVTSLHYHLPWLVKALHPVVAVLRRHQAEDAPRPGLGRLLRRRRGHRRPRGAAGGARQARQGATRRRPVRAVLRRQPRRPRPGRPRLLRHRTGTGDHPRARWPRCSPPTRSTSSPTTSTA